MARSTSGISSAFKTRLNRGWNVFKDALLGTKLYDQLPTADEAEGLASGSPTGSNPVICADDNKIVNEYTTQVDVSDLSASAVSQAVALASFPANVVVLGACVELDTEFSGGGSSSCTAQLGDAADPNELAAAVNVFTGAGTGLKDGEPTAVTGFGFKAAYAPKCTITSDVNVDTLTAGVLQVHILYRTVAAAT